MAYDGEIKINTTIDTKNVSAQMLSIDNQIAKTADKIDLLKQKMSAMKDSAAPTSEYKSLQNQIEKAKLSLDGLAAKEESLTGRMQNVGAGKEYQGLSKEFDSILKKESDVQLKIEAITAKMNEMETAGTAFDYPEDSSKYIALNNQLKEATNNMHLLGVKHDELVNKQNAVKSNGEKAMNSVAKSTRKASSEVEKASKKGSNAVESFGKRVWGLAKRVFVFSLVARAFRAMVAGIKDGLDKFSQYSAQWNKVMSDYVTATGTLKNTLATAFAPILSMIIPAITQLINYLIAAINTINEFVAVLSGKNTWTKAITQQKDYAKSLDKTSASAKKAQSTLAGFDDLDVWQAPTDSGAGGGADSGANMFEQVTIPESTIGKFKEIQDALKSIIERAKELKSIFEKGFFDGFNNGSAIFDDMIEHIKYLGKTLAEIWNDPEVSTARKNFEDSVFLMFGQISGAAADIAVTIGDNLFGGLDLYFTQNSARVKNWLISMFDIGSEISTLIGRFTSAFAYIFEAFSSDPGKNFTKNFIGIFIDAFMGVIELASKFVRDIIGILFDPIIENTEKLRNTLEEQLANFSRFFAVIKSIVDEFVDGFNDMYDEHLKPFFDDVADGLSRILSAVLDAMSYIMPWIQLLIEKFAELNDGSIAPFFTEMFKLLGNLIDILDLIWNNILVPLFVWIAENVMPLLGPIFYAIGEGVLNNAKQIIDFATKVLKYLNIILDFLKLVFKGDWEKAWDMIADALSKAWDHIVDLIKEHVNSILQAVEDMVNKAIDGINKIIDGLNSISSFKMPEWLGGGEVGLNISDLKHVSIKGFATGGVFNGGSPFLGVLNDQPAGQTNVEAPLSTIVSAFRQVAAEMSGGSNATMEMDGETFARLIVPHIGAENTRIGVSLADGV